MGGEGGLVAGKCRAADSINNIAVQGSLQSGEHGVYNSPGIEGKVGRDG